MEAGVPDREQVDFEREKVEGRQDEDQQRTLKHVTSWMACGWNELRTETP